MTAARIVAGLGLMAYGFGLCYDAVMRWMDRQKSDERR